MADTDLGSGYTLLDEVADAVGRGASNVYQAVAAGASDAASQVRPAIQQIANYDYRGLADQITGDLQQMAAHASSVGRGLPSLPTMWDHAKQFISNAWSGLQTARSNASAVPYSIQQTQNLPSLLQQANPYQH